MLARLSGILEELTEHGAVVALPQPHPGTQIAYEVLLPAYLIAALEPRLGSVVTLHTLQSFEQQAQGSSFVPRLIGFGSVTERRFFQVFTTVKGVGSRRALRALALPIGEIARAICDRDTKALVALPEIGKRLAETIVAELHGKIDEFALPADDAPRRNGAASRAGLSSHDGLPTDAARQAAAALVRLGESESDAAALVRRALEGESSEGSPDEVLTAALALR